MSQFDQPVASKEEIKCPVCSLPFDTWKELAEHKAKEHPEGNPTD